MLTMLGFIALVAVSSHLAPQLASRDIFFGVTVAPGFRDAPVAQAVVWRYRREIWFLAFVVAGLVALSSAPLLSTPMLLAQGFGASVAFAKARSSVLPYAARPTTLREAALGPRGSLPGGILGQLGPFLVLIAAAVYVGLHWDQIPAKFPTHWNIAGRPNGWTHKTATTVYLLPWVGFIACAMMFVRSYAVLHGARLPRVTGDEGRLNQRVRQINLLAMLASEYMIALIIFRASVVTMFSPDAEHMRLPLSLRIAPFVVILVSTVAVRLARSTARATSPPIGDATPDSCWIWGQLYYNRTDPALFVEKRMGLGYTLNLGNRTSWLVVVAGFVALSVTVLLAS